MNAPTLLLTGPTGIGKTALAIELARRVGGELISADSMQVYRGLAIGTAQPTPEEQARARFHLTGVLEPGAPFSVQSFLKMCDAAHREIEARGQRPIYVGGTGLYLRALRWGLFDGGPRDDALRERLEAQCRDLGTPALHARLGQADPESAARIHPNDAIRVVRALEVLELTGRPISAMQRQWEAPRPRFAHRLVVLCGSREAMRRRIEARARTMLAQGWIEEVEALLEAGVPRSAHCFKALGYRAVIDCLDGRLGLDELHARILSETWSFARRQLTWFRRERPACWIDLESWEEENRNSMAEILLERVWSPPL